ncbi:MAG TPA: AAA family ATPase [Polyangiaceae bacterium]|nr:AAA family ATPase [Polyangiaceae bacterium]
MTGPDDDARRVLAGGRFAVRRQIGAGGMGVVYEVEDAAHGGRWALKRLPTLSPEALLRFKNEFRSLQGLSHPNLVSLGELFEERGEWFFTMEFVRGQTFLRYVRGLPFDAEPASGSSGRSPEPPAPEPPSAETGGPTRRMPLAEEGSDEPARAAPAVSPFDEPRLRACLAQLAEALGVLHRADKLHCDLKPANILVSAEGRVVVLDFGLATEVGGRPVRGRQVIGTAAYMSPEQAAGRPLTSAADWYSVGVLLYEALTGERPYRGTSSQVLSLKQRFAPTAVRDRNPRAPDDLAALCDALLAIDPAARPDGERVLGALRAGAAGPSPPRAVRFVGRAPELGVLWREFERVRAGGAGAVLVEGASGVGKTALVREFLGRVGGEALVIRGRCYEREAVPYKAYDAAMDELSARLAEAPPGRVPGEAQVLARAFPVLRQAPGFEAPAPELMALDPHALRDRLFGGLRALLAALGAERPVVLAVDDVHWSDEDSLALTTALVREPMPARVLVVATLRAPAGPRVAAAFGERARRLVVDRLTPEDARELARRVLPPGAQALAPAISEEGAGHPLFIHELGRHAAAHPEQARAGVQLDAALRARVEALAPSLRELVELLSAHGAPLGQGVLAAAAGLDFAEYTPRARALRAMQLVHAAGAQRGDPIEPYHDRIREAVQDAMAPAVRARRHRALAEALERLAPEQHEALAQHWQGAGDRAVASRHAEIGAGQARSLLAYAQEAKLLRLALELDPRAPDERGALRRALARALRNAGFAAEAGREYLAAAPLRPAESIELERLGAECLLQSGHVDDGLAALRRVVRSVGLRVPTTPRGVLLALLWNRLRLALRGLGYRATPASEVSAKALQKIDLCWSGATGLVMIETLIGWLFQSEGVLLSLDAGEPKRVARALTLELALGAHVGRRPWDESLALSERVQGLARELGDPYVAALGRGMLGVAAFERGLLRRAIVELTEAERALERHCAGTEFELTAVRFFAHRARAMSGDWRELARCVPEYVRRARERDDLLAAATLSIGYVNLAWLAVDRPDLARRAVGDAMGTWSRQGFHVEHALALYAELHIDLYEGEGGAAHERLERQWETIRTHSLSRSPTFRNLFLHHRAAAAAAAPGGGGDGGRRRRVIEQSAAQLARSPSLGFRARATLLRAVLAHWRGDAEGARGLLEAAARSFDEAEMYIYASAMRYRAGALSGGARGAELVRAAEGEMRAAGAEAPGRVARMFAPGFGAD